MESNYNKYLKVENELYQTIEIKVPVDSSSGNEQLDYGLDWISRDSSKILDFGCGSGVMEPYNY